MGDSFFNGTPVASGKAVKPQRDKGGDKPLYATSADKHIEVIGGITPGDGEVALFLPDDLMDGSKRRPANIPADK